MGEFIPAAEDTGGIREYYGDGLDVGLLDGRPVVRAYTEAGQCKAPVDIGDVISWVARHHPEWLPPLPSEERLVRAWAAMLAVDLVHGDCVLCVDKVKGNASRLEAAGLAALRGEGA